MILVSGGTGLIGSHLLHTLLEKKSAIRAIYRSEESLQKTQKVFESYDSNHSIDEVEWVKADITDYYSLKDIFPGITKVYHCAAMVSFDARDVDAMMKINIEGTENMVNLSSEFNVEKFCYVSSVAALGKYPDHKCTDEDALWQHSKDSSNYSISKYYAENEVWRASEEGLEVVIVNPATVIGFGNWDESSSAIVKRVYDGLRFYTGGSNGFVGVQDVIRAMTVLMESEITNERFLLVSENLTFKKLLQTIATGLGKKPPTLLASKKLANILLKLDQFRAFILQSRSVLTKESVQTAYKDKCYSATKIQTKLGFEFAPMEGVIKSVTAQYR